MPSKAKPLAAPPTRPAELTEQDDDAADDTVIGAMHTPTPLSQWVPLAHCAWLEQNEAQYALLAVLVGE